MSLINRFFNNKKIDCPRCLGKGYVDWDDIKRLKKELKWIPGSCAYCNGKGEINSDLQSKIAVNTTYLTTDLSLEERKKLIANDEEAKQRALYYETQTDNFISEVEYLHFTGNIDSNIIANFYVLHQNQSEIDLKDRNELIDYIERIIELKNKN
ncbi:MAG: hypothetical protein ABJK28_09850 [Algibacter sp.]